jgi:hypothetical protein
VPDDNKGRLSDRGFKQVRLFLKKRNRRRSARAGVALPSMQARAGRRQGREFIVSGCLTESPSTRHVWLADC